MSMLKFGSREWRDAFARAVTESRELREFFSGQDITLKGELLVGLQGKPRLLKIQGAWDNGLAKAEEKAYSKKELDVVLFAGLDVYKDILEGKESLFHALLTGRLKVKKGNISFLLKHYQFFYGLFKVCSTIPTDWEIEGAVN